MSGAAEVKDVDSAALSAYGDALSQKAFEGPQDQIGERLVRTFLTFWEDPQRRPQLLEVIKSATTSDAAAAQLREFLSSKIFGQLAETLKVPAPVTLDRVAEALKVPTLQLNAAVAQVMGVVMLRYVLEVEPIASATEDELLQLLSPTIQRYLSA
jgi:hypothetical protein